MKSPQKPTAKKRVAVTGGTGKLGRVCVQDLLAHSYDVFVVDTVAPEKGIPGIIADLADFGQTLDAFSSVGHEIHAGVGTNAFDAIVHLAAFPTPRQYPDAHLFQNNIMGTYNVFEAARRLGIHNVIWASSETTLGEPFEGGEPYAPVDEDYPLRAKSAYALAKVLMEDMARQFVLQTPAMKLVGLRFSNVMEPADYARFPAYDHDPEERKWNMWAYIDARDGSQAIRKALEWEATGMHPFIIANADTVMSKSSTELMKNYLPNVPVRKKLGEHETLLSIEKARKVLGYEPEFSWREAKSR
ncbi:NAD-dependent epimerase/dehydratase family protein [Hymenobacter sp. BRD67]|uniref:NAD-dependent epimerase/dehydratase family protein n=1 Tax=Hymenobacter sp. BRD67 TaxID=2675877 RepID=UPI00156741A4|nr:NAD(P)-dependent oxidoreductase [Hymenobacter sp. BRD67]QKG51289.1 NAD(P)-dependent oxidoreductase [Hymenobacter sp. BRD67]